MSLFQVKYGTKVQQGTQLRVKLQIIQKIIHLMLIGVIFFYKINSKEKSRFRIYTKLQLRLVKIVEYFL
jgi:hypothetical protein